MFNEFQKINIFTHHIKNCLTLLGLVEIYIEDLTELFTGENGQRKRIGLDDLKIDDVMVIFRKNLPTMINYSLN